ncbi:MAG: DeoR/GlpR family DNA-binding transcription regulator [Desulfobacterales bacterium]
MYPFERLEKIAERLKASGQIKIHEDAKRFGVSKATLHRDLDLLERQGMLIKVRGGAVLRERLRVDTHFQNRRGIAVAEKQKIAEAAAASVRDDTSIFLDHSSTVAYLAEALARRVFRNLIVVTNSLFIPGLLGNVPGIQVILTGGRVEPDFQALSGRWVIESFRSFNFHQVFVSCGAVTVEGFLTQTPFIHEILCEILNRGGVEIHMLVDSSKFQKIATFRVAPVRAAAKIYTDSGIPKAIRERLSAAGVPLIVAS